MDYHKEKFKVSSGVFSGEYWNCANKNGFKANRCLFKNFPLPNDPQPMIGTPCLIYSNGSKSEYKKCVMKTAKIVNQKCESKGHGSSCVDSSGCSYLTACHVLNKPGCSMYNNLCNQTK